MSPDGSRVLRGKAQEPDPRPVKSPQSSDPVMPLCWIPHLRRAIRSAVLIGSSFLRLPCQTPRVPGLVVSLLCLCGYSGTHDLSCLLVNHFCRLRLSVIPAGRLPRCRILVAIVFLPYFVCCPCRRLARPVRNKQNASGFLSFRSESGQGPISLAAPFLPALALHSNGSPGR